MGLYLLFAFLLTGLLLGYLGVLPRKILQLTDKMVEIGLLILLASMGAKIGMDREILSQLDSIGLQAFFISTGSIAGSLLLVKLFSNLVTTGNLTRTAVAGEEGFSDNPEIGEKSPADSSAGVSTGIGEVEKEIVEDEIVGDEQGHKVMTIKIITAVTGGIILGLFLVVDYLPVMDFISTSALSFLLLGIGIEIGGNKEMFRQIKLLGWKIILLPVLVALGSIVGAVIAGFFLRIAPGQSAAVGAGFGWYSLSGVLLSKLHSVELGSIAFLANVFRELSSILIMPLVVKYLGNLSGVAPGGATTMDSTLPVIKKVAGTEMVVPAFINGAVLSALVPILVPLLIKL